MGRSGEEFLIRFHPNDVTFPDICPVCSEKAEAMGSVYLYQYNSDSLLPWLRSMSPDRLRIPVCDTHSLSERQIADRKALRALFLGIAIISSLYFILQVFLSITGNASWNHWFFLLPAVTVVLILAVRKVLPSNELEKIFIILDYDGSTVTTSIENEEYTKEFLRINSNAHKVSQSMVRNRLKRRNSAIGG